MTTTSTQNYLKAIRELRCREERVTTGVLARRLNVTSASATNKLQRLAAAGFLDYQPHRGVTLTELGEREAAAVLHRHEIIERYLISFLGFSSVQAHAEAEQLEHAVSMDLVCRMSDAVSATAASSDCEARGRR